MSLVTAPKPIQGHLRQRINKAAHRKGRNHEVASLVVMLTQVEVARDSGATHDELDAIVKTFEADQ
jgi:hypothetical protein